MALKDKEILMLLGPRYQDEEAKVPLDFLRGKGAHVDVVSINKGKLKGLHGAEIEANITAQGFFPIDTSSAHPFSEGSLANPAVITDANYQTADPTYTSSNPSGFCLSVNG